MSTNESGQLFLGLDISTQQVKGILINQDLKTVWEDGINFDNDLPSFKTEGGVHIHSDRLTVTSPTLMWVKAIDRLLDRLQNSCDVSKIVAISGAGQQHGSVYWAIGSKNVLMNLNPDSGMYDQLAASNAFSFTDSPVWMDSSTTKQCQQLEQLVGGAEVLANITGSRAYERFTGNQIAKLFQQHGSNYNNTEHISLVSSFGTCLFRGVYAPIDYSDASGMNLMDIKQKMWSQNCLDACAPHLEKLLYSPVPSDTVSGKISPYMVERFGFNDNCDIVSFTGDNPASLAGMRLQKGEIIISLGTSDTLFLWLTDPQPALEGHIFVNPVDVTSYMALLCYKNGSLTRENIRNQCANASWSRFEELLKSSPKGNSGNIGIYYDIAEITPSNACGIFRFNVDDKPVKSFTPAEDVRAVIEGQFLAKRVHAEKLGYSVASGESRILATGGASNSKEILQVMADVFNSPVYVLDIPNSAALGSAYRAKHGHEKFTNNHWTFAESVKNAPEYICAATPAGDVAQIYSTLARRYRMLEEKYTRV